MARFEIRFKRSVVKELLKLSRNDNRKAMARIQALSEDPRPTGCEKLAGHESYRVRQGDYRIIYTIDDGRIVVEMIRVGHRRDVYRH
jgi:mRNA interferase RelE/StbE